MCYFLDVYPCQYLLICLLYIYLSSPVSPVNCGPFSQVIWFNISYIKIWAWVISQYVCIILPTENQNFGYLKMFEMRVAVNLWWLNRSWITTHSPSRGGMTNSSQTSPVCLSVCLSVYGSTALLLDFGCFFSFLILYTVGRTSWTGDSPPQSRYLLWQQKHRINAHRHPYLQWVSNQRSQCSSERRQFIP
jgi:hypothetical protein